MSGLGFLVGAGAGSKHMIDSAAIVQQILQGRQRQELLKQQLLMDQARMGMEQERFGLDKEKFGLTRETHGENIKTSQFNRGKALLEAGDEEGAAPLMGARPGSVISPVALRAIEQLMQFDAPPANLEGLLTRQLGGDTRAPMRQGLNAMIQRSPSGRALFNRGGDAAQPAAPQVDLKKITDVMAAISGAKKHDSLEQFVVDTIKNPDAYKDLDPNVIAEAKKAVLSKGDPAMLNAMINAQELTIKQLREGRQAKTDEATTAARTTTAAAAKKRADTDVDQLALQRAEASRKARENVAARLDKGLKEADDAAAKEQEVFQKTDIQQFRGKPDEQKLYRETKTGEIATKAHNRKTQVLGAAIRDADSSGEKAYAAELRNQLQEHLKSAPKKKGPMPGLK